MTKPQHKPMHPSVIPAPQKPFHVSSKFLAYMPTFSPHTEAVEDAPNKRDYPKLNLHQIADRLNEFGYFSRIRPWVYLDCIDSVLTTRPDVHLAVGDARSTDSIRTHLRKHYDTNSPTSKYSLGLYNNKESQWTVFNDVLANFATPETEYFIYTSSDVIWTMDWVAEAVKEFEADPELQIVFPCVNSGDPSLPCQILTNGPEDRPLIDPADPEHMSSAASKAARAPVLNAYAFIMRMDFLKTYGGYMNVWLNCFSESFLYYMCEAMGGKMRLMPRAWVFHHGSVDMHEGDAPGAGGYNYLLEKPKFDKIMDKVQLARMNGTMTVDFLKGLLYV